MRAICTFKVESWDEQPIEEHADGRKSTHAIVRQSVEGDVTGTGLAHWLMCYRPDGTADYLGLQLVQGRVGDMAGSFTCSSTGTFDGQTADGTMRVLDDSGTGAFAGIAGSATFRAPHGHAATVEFDLQGDREASGVTADEPAKPAYADRLPQEPRAPDVGPGDPPAAVRGLPQTIVDPPGDAADDGSRRWDPRTEVTEQREGA